MSILSLKECWRMFLNHNNIKGCWILWIKCPSHHNNIKRCWIKYPKTNGVSIQTYKFNDRDPKLKSSTKLRGWCFPVGFPGQVPGNISESTEKIRTGEWSGGLAGKFSPFQRQTYEITQRSKFTRLNSRLRS